MAPFGAALGDSGKSLASGDQGSDSARPHGFLDDLWKYPPEVPTGSTHRKHAPEARTVTSSPMLLNGGRPAYVIVKRTVWLVPPLEQPRSPEVPLGVFTVTLAVPGAEIKAVVIVTCNC